MIRRRRRPCDLGAGQRELCSLPLLVQAALFEQWIRAGRGFKATWFMGQIQDPDRRLKLLEILIMAVVRTPPGDQKRCLITFVLGQTC